jgi:hypothetical protein
MDEGAEIAMIVRSMTDCTLVQSFVINAGFKQLNPGHYNKKDGYTLILMSIA